MKVFVAIACLIAIASAAPAAVETQAEHHHEHQHHDVVPIVAQETAVEHDGHFHYSFESGDGTKAEQAGELRVFDKDHAGEVVSGQVSYIGDDGKTYSLSYVADENGYQPHGDHLPVAPPVPEPIARALQFIAEHPHQDKDDH